MNAYWTRRNRRTHCKGARSRHYRNCTGISRTRAPAMDENSASFPVADRRTTSAGTIDAPHDPRTVRKLLKFTGHSGRALMVRRRVNTSFAKLLFREASPSDSISSVLRYSRFDRTMARWSPHCAPKNQTSTVTILNRASPTMLSPAKRIQIRRRPSARLISGTTSKNLLHLRSTIRLLDYSCPRYLL